MTIYAVFNSDGHECKDFVGAFESEEAASGAARRIEGLIRHFYAEHMEGMNWSGFVSVEPVVLDNYELPADANFALKNPRKI